MGTIIILSTIFFFKMIREDIKQYEYDLTDHKWDQFKKEIHLKEINILRKEYNAKK